MREKFRIRLYNCNAAVIHLEKKSKRNGLGTKLLVAGILFAKKYRR